jgi:hypothetical protein
MKQPKSDWLKGYACAVATLIRMEGGMCIRAEELIRAAGGVEAFKEAGADPYDMEAITPIPKKGKP